ncbi:hypothetical protein [Alicyclobacillus fodiniaquatilis]|uniref:Uncharacterized protein n=1 Tax=Alicyclobacillus fodiniaquatilis TaxID=1661150 RepID=A0ABW4JKY0_9BACL
MISAVQMSVGQTRIFTRDHETSDTMTVHLKTGEALVINRGFHNTIFVKSGIDLVHNIHVINLKLGQTVIVKSVHKK